MAGILQAIVTTAMELDGSRGMVWIYLWNGLPDARAIGRAAKVRGVTKELKFAVRVENPGTPAEAYTVTLDTKAMNGNRKAKKTATRIMGFQFRGDFATELEALLLTLSVRTFPSTGLSLPAFTSIEAGKVHSLIEVSHLLRIPVKHLSSHTIWVEQG